MGMLPTWAGNYFRNVLGITALIELAVAAGLLIAGLYVPEARGGLWFTAAILGVVGWFLLAWARRAARSQATANRIRAHGLDATATVTELTQTGLRVNDNPQVKLDLRIEIEGRDPYMVTHKVIVPTTVVGQLTSGEPLPVKVDPNDLSKVVMLWGDPGPEGAAGMDPGQLRKIVKERREKVNEDAIAATATIRTLKDGGVDVGEYRIHAFEAEFRFEDGRPSFRDEGNAAVPNHLVGKLKPGMEIPAKVSRSDPSLYYLDWDAAPVL